MIKALHIGQAGLRSIDYLSVEACQADARLPDGSQCLGTLSGSKITCLELAVGTHLNSATYYLLAPGEKDLSAS